MGAESGTLEAPPNALTLDMLIYEGQSSDRDGDRTTNPCEIRRLLTPHPRRPGQPDSLGGRGPELPNRGVQANAREHSAVGEAVVPTRGLPWN